MIAPTDRQYPSEQAIWETAMSKFQLCDAVSLTEPIAFADRKIAPPETAWALVVRAGRPYIICG